MGSLVNEGKTKYMDTTENYNYKFKKVDDFKHLAENISNNIDMHIEINKRTDSGNRCYYSNIKLL